MKQLIQGGLPEVFAHGACLDRVGERFQIQLQGLSFQIQLESAEVGPVRKRKVLIDYTQQITISNFVVDIFHTFLFLGFPDPDRQVSVGDSDFYGMLPQTHSRPVEIKYEMAI